MQRPRIIGTRLIRSRCLLIVTGTNEARRQINALAREGLGTAGKGLKFDTLTRRDTTRAERRYAKNYHIDDVIQPEKTYRNGLERGQTYRIVKTGPGNRLTVEAREDGRRIVFSPSRHRKLSVYEPEQTELAPGDLVRITRNGASLDLANGDRFTVSAVRPGRVTLTGGGRVVELDGGKPLHLDHAHASTVHGAQGLTCERVLIDALTRSRTTARDTYYTAISRARLEARIYTDDLGKLPGAIAQETVKHAALDLARGGVGGRRPENGRRHAHVPFDAVRERELAEREKRV